MAIVGTLGPGDFLGEGRWPVTPSAWSLRRPRWRRPCSSCPARYGKKGKPGRVLPRISQEALAETVGTTRSRVNVFMNRFKKLGFVEHHGGLKINPSIVTVVVDDSRPSVPKDNRAGRARVLA